MREIQYGSVCSGIESATVAWHPLDMHAAWYAEIEPFPCAVLAHHYPDVPNHGDMTRLAAQVMIGSIPAPDLLVGGTPCQAFSVAGMRAGLSDPRGALTIKYVELLDAIDHVRIQRGEPEAVCLWENVPGVLSDKGNAFGCFLGALVGESEELRPPGGRWKDAGCVYGPRRTVAWRILDAQYFGLAQRRRRVFVVASARRGFDPCEVLFEREGMRRDTAPRRGEGQDLTGHAPFRSALKCGCGCTFEENLGAWGCPDCEGDEGPAVGVIAGVPAYGGHSLNGSVDQSATLTAKDTRMDMESETFFVAPTMAGVGRKKGGYSLDDIPITAGTLMAGGKGAGSATQQDAEAGLLVVHGTQDPCISDKAFALGRNSGQENVLALSCKDHGADAGVLSPTLRAMNHSGSHANAGGQVAICMSVALRGRDGGSTIEAGEDISGCLRASSGGGYKPHALISSQVRRLTPRECERLQGFPDDYTQIPYRKKPADLCPDGPRYKAIGNSKAVPVVRWIGQRILQQL